MLMPFLPQKVRLILVIKMPQSLAITPRGTGIFSRDSTINTGDGNDTITGTGLLSYADYGIRLWGTSFDTGKGNDTITGTSSYVGFYNTFDSSFNTDEGNDIITGNTSANTGFINQGFMDTGDGNDIITGNHINEDEGEFNILGVGFVN